MFVQNKHVSHGYADVKIDVWSYRGIRLGVRLFRRN